MTDLMKDLYSKFLESEGVSIDTRTIRKGNLFFAVNGPNFNANKFAEDALQKGATYAVIDDEDFSIQGKTILVEDGLKALQDLAAMHRDQFQGPVLGITGSNGKTTTKELVAKVLSEKYKVHATKGNYNNHIGVPLTLLDLTSDIEIAIIEMGANHVGEIASYCTVAKPNHGMITNIGRAHTETFGGIEGIIRGKSELFDFLRKNEGMAFINIEDRVLSNMAKRFSSSVPFPPEGLALVSSTPTLKIALAGNEIVTKITGKYNFSNIAAAVSIGQYFEVEEEKILSAIATYVPDNARSQIIQKGSITIILDAYNANPDSMRVALENLSGQSGKKVAIIGDMNELEQPDEGHREVLDYAEELGIESVFTVGEKIGRVANPSTHFQTKDLLANQLRKEDFSDTTVLLKASRSIKLETLLTSFE